MIPHHSGFEVDRVRDCVLHFLLEYKILYLLGFFDRIKTRRKKYPPNQLIILSEPVFSITLKALYTLIFVHLSFDIGESCKALKH